MTGRNRPAGSGLKPRKRESGAETEVGLYTAFAEKTNIPVVTRTQGRGVLPDSHWLAVTGGQMELLMTALTQADAFLLLGTRLNFTLLYGRPFHEAIKIIQVDIEAEELGFNRGPDIGIYGDVRLVLEQLTAQIGPQPERAWTHEVKTMVH